VSNLFTRSVVAFGTVAVLAAGPPPAEAQWHGAGYGHVHVGISVGFGFGFGWYPYYSPWYPFYPYRFGWYGPYPYPYPYYPYYPSYPYGYSPDMLTASMRLEVKPADADVYVDGYLAGKVNNFDGMFDRLRVKPGEHELVLYHDGYHEVQQHVYLGPNSDQKVQFAMQPLSAGEPNDARPTPPPNSDANPTTNEVEPYQMNQPPPGYGRGGPPPGYGQGGAPPSRQGEPPQSHQGEMPPSAGPPHSDQTTPDPRSFGALSLLVQPSDAEILIDGASWSGASGESRVVIQLPEGRHHIEISKGGFAKYVEDVGIQRGRTLSLNVSLIHQPDGGQ
jgi:PEGA domain